MTIADFKVGAWYNQVILIPVKKHEALTDALKQTFRISPRLLDTFWSLKIRWNSGYWRGPSQITEFNFNSSFYAQNCKKMAEILR